MWSAFWPYFVLGFLGSAIPLRFIEGNYYAAGYALLGCAMALAHLGGKKKGARS